MNIETALLENRIHLKIKAMLVADYACQSPENFASLMACFLSADHRLAQRAAWSVSWSAKKYPGMIAPHIASLVAQLQREDVHDAVIRNSVRVLEAIAIPEALHGDVMNACFNFIEKPFTPVAIKAFSLTTLYNLSKTYPEIIPELILLIKDRMDHETAAFKSRGKKILQQLEKRTA